MKYFEDKTNRLYIIMAGFFIANAMVAEFMGVKIFSVEGTFGLTKPVFDLLGVHFDGISLTCGVILWSLCFCNDGRYKRILWGKGGSVYIVDSCYYDCLRLFYAVCRYEYHTSRLVG